MASSVDRLAVVFEPGGLGAAVLTDGLATRAGGLRDSERIDFAERGFFAAVFFATVFVRVVVAMAPCSA